MLFLQERYHEAKKIYKQHLPIIKEEKGENSSYYGIAIGNYAISLAYMKKFSKAEETLNYSLHIKFATLGI